MTCKINLITHKHCKHMVFCCFFRNVQNIGAADQLPSLFLSLKDKRTKTNEPLSLSYKILKLL